MEKLKTYGWLFILIAMVGDLLVSFVLSMFYGEYSNFKMSISALGNPSSPVRIPFNIWMLIEGILFLVALPAINNTFRPISGGITKTLLIFVSLFAIGACIFTCFFSVNESKDVVTLASKIHGAGSVIGFMLFLFVPLLLGILYYKDRNHIMGTVSIICFVTAMIFFVLFVMSDKQEFKDTFINNEGLWQRLNLAFMYLPVAITAIIKIGK
ncbi:MAG: DUF998 domain-containing protein [Lachnospiraceae bacterium]|nr:DUF998 domain-containing protein [Lachnospiraceae bacterium]